MRILELTNYTAGGCGVGMRVLKESQLLAARGHTVAIFSTNRTKGSNALCSLKEQSGKVMIRRFPAVKLGGESYMYWNFKKEAIAWKPDIIIAHAYRHPHTTQALSIGKLIGCKVILVTHASFGRESSRSAIANRIVKYYDNYIGRKSLPKFAKIITITQWENKYLFNLGINKEKIIYSPNGVSEEFFKPIKKPAKKLRKIIYCGRISPIKQIESLIKAIAIVRELPYSLTIYGPVEKDYAEKLKNLIRKERLDKKILFVNKTYNSSEQIKMLDSSDIYVLPSKSEGMPQAMIEAMARGKIVIGSDNLGNKELISPEKNGYLFKNGNASSLANTLQKIKSLSTGQINKISTAARTKAEEFRWKKIISSYESMLKHLVSKEI